MSLTLESRLTLIPMDIRQDKTRYIVEALGEFFEMPEICIKAINLANNGESLKEIERLLKEKYPDADVDLLNFTNQLLELGLVAEINGVKVNAKEENREYTGFLNIPPELGRLFFNKFTYFIYFGSFLADIILFIFHPNLFPRYKDLFIFHFMALNIPILIILSTIFVLIHEYGHVLAMRTYNLPAKLGFGHRLFLVVLETDMTSVWKLASKERNVLYLAGMCFDSIVLFLALAFQLTFPHNSVIFLGIMHIIVFYTFIRMVYQCCIFMKTDLYYVFENVSGCYNLMENAQQGLRKHIPFIKDLKTDEVMFNEEKRTVFIYSICYFIGVCLSISLFFIYYIPQLLYAAKKVLPGFARSPFSLPFWDSVLFALQLLVVLSFLLKSWRKKYLQG